MNPLVELLISTVTQGLIYALIAFGVYITYTILDFPDLSVDGSFPLGAAVTAVLLVRGANPYLTLLIASLEDVTAKLYDSGGGELMDIRFDTSTQELVTTVSGT